MSHEAQLFPRPSRRRSRRADMALDDAIRSVAGGGLALLVPASGRVEAPSLVAAADRIDAATVNAMIRDAGGLVRVALHAGECARLGLRPQRPGLARRRGREEFLIPVEARAGVTTGISAPDRARTLRIISAADSTADDLAEPGHVAVVRAATGGVHRRAGVAEAALELCRLAGRREAAALCHVLDAAGMPATGRALIEASLCLAAPICHVGDVVDRIATEVGAWLPMPC